MRKPLDLTTGKMKYFSKLIVRCWTFGMTFSRSHLPPPASATSRKTAKSPPGLVSAVRCWITLSLLCPGTEVRVLVFDASMRFTSGGSSHGLMFCQADTAPEALLMDSCSARQILLRTLSSHACGRVTPFFQPRFCSAGTCGISCQYFRERRTRSGDVARALATVASYIRT
jgi:hypothetical protein